MSRHKGSFKCVTLNYEMDSSNEDIDQQVLQEAGEQTISAEWSATVSALSSSDTTSSNTYINIETLKECCANPSDTLKDKEDFMVFESSSTVLNTSKFNANDTKCRSEYKTTAFQKRKRLRYSISEDFIEFNNVVDDSSINNNIMDVSKADVLKQKFSRKNINVPDTAFDNIINDLSMTCDSALNNKKTSLNEISVSNVNNTPMFSKTNLLNLNHTYDVHINTDSSTFQDSISDDADIPRLKQNTVFKKPSNTSILSNDSSNSINVSNKEVFTRKFNRKIIDITNSAFDNIINDSSMTSDIALNNKNTSLNEVSVSNVNNTPMFSKTNLINLNHTYDVHINTDSSTFKDSISDDADIPRLKQNTVFKKPSNTSILSNDGSNSIDVSNKEVFTHKFNRKIIDITNSAFDNIINDSSMTSDIALNNKNISLNEVSVSNVNNTPVFNPMDISNLNHTYNVPIINNTTFLDNVVENDKSMSETPTLLKFNTPKSLNLLPLKFNFSNKIGRHSLSYQEKCTSFDGIKKHNISLNTDFIEYTRDKSNTFKVGGNNENIDTHLHTSKIQETNKSSQETQPLDDSLSTNKLNQEQLKLKCSISSNLNNKDLLLPNTTKLLENNEFQKNQSKNSISSNYSSNEGLTLLNSTTGLLESCSSLRNQSRLLTSKNSKSSISHNTFNSTMELLDSNESQKTQLTYSTSVISNNDSLTLLSTTVGSLESNESQKTQSKRSISPSDNESLKSTNRRSSSRNKSSLTSNHSTSVISNNDSLTLLSTTVGSLESNESQKTQSKRSISPSDNESLKSTNRCSSPRNKSSLMSNHSTSVISNNDSLALLNTTMGSLKNNESQKTQSKRSISPSYNESLKSTNRRSSFRNKSLPLISKPSTSGISNNDSTTSLNSTTGLSVSGRSAKIKSQKIQSKPLKCATLNIEDLSTLNTPTASLKQNVSKQTSNCLSNVAPIIIDGLTTMNTTAEPFEQNVISIHQSNSSPNISIKTSINTLILEDDTNYTNKIYSSSSKQENHLHNNIDQVNPYITDGSLVEIRSSKVRVLRSSLGINKNNSLLTRSLTSNNNVNKLSTGSTRTSKSVVNFNDESFNNNSDNSLFWTTLPDETTSISNTQNNVNVNTFQTPKSNKLIITENIVNTIKIMSTNKQKSTHPGAFELDDHNDGPLTRSFVTRSCNRSPSILTLVFGGQKMSESTSSLTHSLSETIIDQSPVEKSIKQKFKSLYKKESWITKRLYKFLIIKLQPNYNIYSVKYAEKFIKYLAMLLKQIYNDKVNLQLYTDMLRYHMARYGIIKDTFDYLGFLSDYIPMAYYKKLVPGWNLETSAVKFDPQKYYIPLMDDEEFLNYIMKHLKEA